MIPELHLLGVSFRTAPAAVRETLAFTGDEAADLLRQAAARLPGVEAMVVSTCNRTECYVVGDEAVLGRWYSLLRRARPAARVLDDRCGRYHHRDEAAFRHLVRVACGLDSAILGDTQILSQLRAALRTAEASGTLGRHLSRAVTAALRAGRQARSETAIGKGAPGIGPSVATTLRSRGVDPATEVAVLGAGEAARAVTRALTKAGYRRLVICNRTFDRSAGLAGDCGGEARPWSELGSVLDRAGAVVAATSARTPVLDGAALARAGIRAAAGRILPPGGRLLVVDAGFPPQVELPRPASGVELVPLDAIRAGADDVTAEREAAVPRVEEIVSAAVADWRQWRSGLPLEEAIRSLHQEAEVLTREAARDLAERSGLSAGDAERILRRSVRRLLHGHVSRLRSLHQEAVA